MKESTIHARDITPPKSADERPGDEQSRRAQNRIQRTESIVNAALRLYLQRSYETVSVQDIAAEAGVAKGSFYRYFDDKATVLQTMLSPVTSSFEETASRCDAQLRSAHSEEELTLAYQLLAIELSAVCLRHRHVVAFYLREARSAGDEERAPLRELRDLIDTLAVRLTNTAMSHGLIRDADPRVSAYAVVGAVENLLIHYFMEEDLGEPTAIAGRLIDLVLHGVGVQSK